MSGRSPSTSEPAVASVLGSSREAIEAATEPSLVGLYLFGSLASHLRRMHASLAEANPEWDGRIEVIYVSMHGLATCRTATTTIAVINPGEPFHIVEAGRDWLLTWYPAREDGG